MLLYTLFLVFLKLNCTFVSFAGGLVLMNTTPDSPAEAVKAMLYPGLHQGYVGQYKTVDDRHVGSNLNFFSLFP